MKSINKHPFFNRLSYSFGNEDWLTELKSLNLQPKDEVLVITASGDRPLHLLLDPCKRITSIDANPVQNYLLSLKMAAIAHLDPDEYLSFLGLKDQHNRIIFFEKLLPYLSPESAGYWLKNKHQIRKGIIYQGAMEKWVKKGAFALHLFKKKEITSLFSIDNLSDQHKFLSTKWSHNLWKKALNFFINPSLSRLFFKDPGIYANHETDMQPGHYIYDRMMDHLRHNLAKDNYFMQLIFLGSVCEKTAPPYLQKANHTTLKSNLSKIQIQTRDIIDFLENSPAHSFDKFSLSDVASYLKYDQFIRLLKALRHAAKPGARFCMRQFMSRYRIPEDISHSFKLEPDLQQRLEKEDRTFVYHFTVGNVIK